MKSEFALALNQICAERSLPREIISKVVESALVTSYRKNANIMNSQNVAATVNIDDGDMRVYVEKEVVDEVLDERTEVILKEALEQKPDAVLGDCIMVDVTPKDFGRIAAQNAKQMIVQKLREAERDFQYNQFVEREGEIVLGLVSSATASGLVLNLGRIEATLPRKEQLPGERYEVGKQVRAYVSEVKRSGRGPQIMLSRTHKNMLRRLLEIVVPEIFDGKVVIKSIAREAGSRSKVAVGTIQSGIDPVGACVGPRGTRIQNIINELSGEKIDVIEWSLDPAVYITKALGPAKVLAVHPSTNGAVTKNATVIVPDDQLSLAIGREGQNARLAARLTGWRIDIKSGSEALNEAVNKLSENNAMQAIVGEDVTHSLATLRELMVRQRAQSTALNADEFVQVKRIVDAVFAYETTQKNGLAANVAPVRTDAVSEARQKAHQAALAAIPQASYAIPLAELGLSARVMENMVRSGILSVGQLLELSTRGDEGLLSIEGIGPKALSEIKQSLEKVVGATPIPTAVEAEPVIEPVVLAELAEPIKDELVIESTNTPVDSPTATVDATPATEEDAAQEFLNAMSVGDDDESKSDVSDDSKKDSKDKAKKSAKGVLVYDEELGRMVVQRPRKRQGDFDGFDE